RKALGYGHVQVASRCHVCKNLEIIAAGSNPDKRSSPAEYCVINDGCVASAFAQNCLCGLQNSTDKVRNHVDSIWCQLAYAVGEAFTVFDGLDAQRAQQIVIFSRRSAEDTHTHSACNLYSLHPHTARGVM